MAGKGKTNGALSRLAARADAGKHEEAPTVQVPLDKIDFDPLQPRIAFHSPDGLVAKSDEEKLFELSELIKAQGLIHPIIVSEKPDGRYLVRVGERRTRACKLLGWTTIKAQIRNDITGMEALALQTSENIGRDDLSPYELALTARRFVTKSEENPTPMTQKKAAEMLGVSEGWMTRYLAFTDEELRDKWVTPGYVDSVESLYQLTRLPHHILELAYADMATGKTETPLTWPKLQFYKKLAKNQTEAAAVAAVAPAYTGSNASPAGGSVVIPGSDGQVDSIAVALGAADSDGVVSGLAGAGDAEGVQPITSSDFGGTNDDYRPEPGQLEALRVATFTPGAGEGGAAVVRHTPSMMADTAVPCKMSMKDLVNLVDRFGDKAGLATIEATFRVPSKSAVVLVREMTGETVEEDRVSILLAKAFEALRS